MAEPTLFGSYLVLKSIASGGMGQIFLAKRTGPEGFEKILALKKMLPHLMKDQRSVSMFLNEAKLAAQLDNPHVVQIYDFGLVDDTYFIAMEYIHGKNLRDLIERTRRNATVIPFRHTLHIMSCVLAGLDFAHKKVSYEGKPLNIVHRDISPQNILISYDGSVKLTDFGIAKATTLESETTLGTIKGKLSYMSPEQVQGEPLDHRTDIFSLGVVLYEMLTGRRLFPDETGLTNVIDRIRRADIPLPRDVNPTIPEELEDILLTTLAKHPHDRFQEAREMASAIGQFARSQGFTTEAYELAAYIRNQFPEEDLSKVLAAEETAFAPSPPRAGQPRPPSRTSVGLAAAVRAAPPPLVTKRLLIAGFVGMIVSFVLIASLPRLFPDALHRGSRGPASTAAPTPAALSPAPELIAAAAADPTPPRTTPAPVPAEMPSASIRVTTSPLGASIWVDGKSVPEKTGATLHLAYGAVHKIRVEKHGYEPKTWEVEPREGEEVNSLHSPLQPLPASLSIETDPPGATVVIEGQEHAAPFALDDLAAKPYLVEARLPGYDPYKETIVPKPGERNAFTLRLRRTAEKAQLKVDTTPWTQVYLDGDLLGETPLNMVEVPTGSHTLRFLRVPKPEEEPQVKVDVSETVQIKPGLNVIRGKQFIGKLQFDVAEVPDYQIGTSRYTQRSVSLPVGEYKVSYTDPRGTPKEVKVSIRNGETTAVR